MKIQDKAKLKEAMELLEEALEKINAGVVINDEELNTPCDIFNNCNDVILDIEAMLEV
ncbi:MAG: hypothetical protein ACXQTI_08205 [Candidatus Nezhaarchaeales archaeon]